MSAVIVQFPSRATGERLRAVRKAISERANATHATIEDRSRAIAAALVELKRSGYASTAIQRGYACLPSVRATPYRQPTFSHTPDAA
jgi:hypothetical protein